MNRTLVLAIVLSLSSAATAHADSGDAVLAAQGWWDELLHADTLPAPTKKAPLAYGVFPYAADACGVFDRKRVDKITSKKPFYALSACLSATIDAEEHAEETWGASDVDTLAIGFDYDKKLEKKVRKAVKKLQIVALEVRGTEDAAAVHVFFAVDKKGNVRGVFMYVDAAG